MKRITFFDVQDYELNVLENYNPKNYRVIIQQSSVNDICDNIVYSAEIISVFTNSLLDIKTLEKFKNLKLIATRSVGFSHIDIEYCQRQNIKILTASHYGDNTVAEFVFAILLNISRHILSAMEDLKNGEINLNDYIGIELAKKTIGIIGLGAIGKEVARIAKGFNMNILGYDILENDFLKKEYSVCYTNLDELLKNSDFVSINAPSTKNNYHLLNMEKLSLMKKSAVLINTARGELIDIEALYEVLRTKMIRAAALDVLEFENILSENQKYLEKLEFLNLKALKQTLVNHKILSLDNVIVTPHIAYNTKEAIKRILQITLKNIDDFIYG